MLDKIEFLISEAAKAFRRNGLMAFAAISTVAISLFLLGGLSYAYWRLSTYAQKTLPTQFTMQVYVKDGTTKPQITEMAQQIRAIPGVAEARYVPKDLAYKRFLEENGIPDFEHEGDMVPIPDMFVIRLAEISDENASDVQSQLAALPTTARNGVRYLVNEQRFVDQLLKLLRVLGTVIGGLLFSTAGILIYNAIRLTIVSRRLEIRVMQLVGASRFTIQVPFLTEGVVQGAIGGAVGALILYATHALLDQALIGYEAFGTLPPFPLYPVSGVLAVIGAAYGFFSSYLALSSPLRYR